MRDAAFMSIAPKADGQRKKIVYMAKRRQQMSKCLYCDAKKGDSPTKPLFFQTLNGGVFGPVILDIDIYDDATLSIGLCDEVVGNVKINYCPVCGRKLKEAADDHCKS